MCKTSLVKSSRGQSENRWSEQYYQKDKYKKPQICFSNCASLRWPLPHLPPSSHQYNGHRSLHPGQKRESQGSALSLSSLSPSSLFSMSEAGEQLRLLLPPGWLLRFVNTPVKKSGEQLRLLLPPAGSLPVLPLQVSGGLFSHLQKSASSMATKASILASFS